MVSKVTNKSKAYRLLEELSIATGERLRVGNILGVRQGETTITDINLMEVARAKNISVRVIKAVGRDEPEKGYDWLFVVRKGRMNSWRCYCVQAKKMNSITQKYNSLRHSVGGDDQIDLLDRYANKMQFVPLYCFYNPNDCVSGHKEKGRCGCNYTAEHFGCTVVPLGDVRKCYQKYRLKTFEALHDNNFAMPWQCLICNGEYLCSRFSKNDECSDEGNSLRPFDGFLRYLDSLEDNVIIGNLKELDRSGIGMYPRRIAIIDLEHEECSG